jgi:hypothetical protein
MMAAVWAAQAGASIGENPFVRPAATPITVVNYPVKLETSALITISADWHGQLPGCYAPDENGSQKIVIDLDTGTISRRRGRGPTVSTASGAMGNYGVTHGFGKRDGADQRGMPGVWDLRVTNPAPCESSPVPAWAGSPTCKRIKDRVATWIQQSSVPDGSGDLTPLASDGFLGIKRVANSARTIGKLGSTFGGDSCLRFLPTSLSASTKDTTVAVSSTDTLLSVPLRGVDTMLRRLSQGGASSRPKVTKRFTMNGDCEGFAASPSTGPDPNFVKSTMGPSRALGSGAGTTYTCTVEVTGYMKLQRVGRVTRIKAPSTP